MPTFSLDSDRLIHSLKTALACLVGLFIGKALHFHSEQWLVITILVVMCAQINVGGVIQKSYMRFLGTLSGSIIAALTLKFFGSEIAVIAIVLAISAMFFSYIATGQNKYSDSGTLGAVTVAIILIAQSPTLSMAAERFAEISLGIIIAGLFSQFVLPIHASTHLRNSQAETMRQLRSYYLATMHVDNLAETLPSYLELDETIVKSLIAQRKLSIDAAREPLGANFNIGHFNQYLWFSKEILRSMSFMHQIVFTSSDCRELFSSVEIIKSFHDAVCQSLASIADGIETHSIETNTILIPNIQILKETIQPRENNLSTENMMYANAYLFCAEILTTHLEKLVGLVKQFD